MRMLLPSLILMLPMMAQAKVDVTEKILQKGLWEDTACKADEAEYAKKDPAYKSSMTCLCQADITYVELSGIPNAQVLNATIYQMAVKAKGGQGQGDEDACSGKKLTRDKLGPDERGTEVSFATPIDFENDALLSIRFSNSGYGEGAAHGYFYETSALIDKKTGKELSNAEILRADRLKALNEYIYDTLKKDDRSFLSDKETTDIDASKGKRGYAYVSAKESDGHFVVDTKDGLSIIFNPYTVGPYSSGPIDLVIPAKFVANPAILKLYGAKHAG